MKAYPAETTEALLDGVASGFGFFGGVPLSVLLDNMKLAVVRILPDGRGSARRRSRGWSATICSRTATAGRARQRQGQCRGAGEVCAPRIPNASRHRPSIAALNTTLEQQCLAQLGEVAGRNPTPIGERLMADLAAFRSLPSGGFEACDMRPGQGQFDGLGALSGTSITRCQRRTLIRG